MKIQQYKVIRLIVGFVLLGLYFWSPQTAWGLIGIVPILTAIVCFCPIYIPFKISTLKKY
ncbi:MAG: DUF2892 domain-containing protein [Bacteroidetes bacterium]|nr:DUF2892 domain-containing protein [Bacteroidota bacterium]MBU1421567.1 DUF2892 domain-containing protein [Bacteroidota bacterium]MBU2636767.1 DUF2892 domain-containing protein [Bacteroidota bacterium]